MFGRSSILGFCVLAYALTWLCWLPLVLARGGSIVLPVSEELLATLGQFGPFAAAFFVPRGRAAFAGSGARLQTRRRGPQPLASILPLVLARLGVPAVQSTQSGEEDLN